MGDLEKKLEDAKEKVLSFDKAGEKFYHKLVEQIEKRILKPRKDCKFCSASCREAAEEIYDRLGHGSYTEIQKLIKEKDGIYISKFAISNHINRHYKKVQVDLAVMEYVEELALYNSERFNKKEMLEDRKSVLNKFIITLGALSEGATIDDIRKNASTVKGLSDAVSIIDKSIEDIDNKYQPVVIFLNVLKELVSSKIREADNQEVKTALLEVMNEVGEKMKEVMAEVDTGEK